MLRRQHPKREYQLVFHSSGVTARDPETHLLDRNLPIVFIDDFLVVGTTTKLSFRNAARFKLSRILKKILIRLKFIDALESPGDNPRTKFRTVQFRGHYTHLALEPNLLNELISLSDASGAPLFDFSKPIIKSQIGIHFRLGDLLNLKAKSYLAPARISSLIQSELSEANNKVVVYTDSIEDFWDRIRESLIVEDVSAFTKDPIATIQELVWSKVFIGTTSKISIWICIFRCHLNVQGISYMPIEMRESLNKQLRYLDSSGIKYYL